MSQHPLMTAHEALQQAIEAYNAETNDFNEVVEERNALAAELDQVKATLEETNKTMLHVHEDRKALLEKHNESVALANAEIKRLSDEIANRDGLINRLQSDERKRVAELANAVAELKELRSLDPKSMKKRLDAQREQNEELKAENARLKTKNTELSSFNERLRKDAFYASKGIWDCGSEKLYPHTDGDVVVNTGEGMVALSCAMWWGHERGMRLMCAYNPESDTISICEPRDDSGTLFLPSVAAEQAMLERFRKMHADKLDAKKKAA
jgi:hypothetical protein